MERRNQRPQQRKDHAYYRQGRSVANYERVLIDDLCFSLPRSGIVGVIGPNGVGMSTLFTMIVGQEPVSSGSLAALVDVGQAHGLAQLEGP